jgi:hypothetical protein
MITPISSVHPSDVHQVSQPPAQKADRPHPQAPATIKSGEVSSDQVTLKSAGQSGGDST